VKKRSIVIVLAVALLLVLAMAGSAMAYNQKAVPSVIGDNCYPIWPDGGTYDGNYSFHIEWELTAGEPQFYQIQFCPSGEDPTLESNWIPRGSWHKITKAELNAGALTTSPYYYQGGLDSDGWRVEIVSNRGSKGLSDFSPEWGA
jgi:hypothetical protein